MTWTLTGSPPAPLLAAPATSAESFAICTLAFAYVIVTPHDQAPTYLTPTSMV